MRTSFHHQPEAQHPKSSAIHKLPADYPIFRGKSGRAADITGTTEFDPSRSAVANNMSWKPRAPPAECYISPLRCRALDKCNSSKLMPAFFLT